MSTSGRFLHELRRRRVFRSAGLYIVGTWVLLQVMDLAFQSFGIQDAALRYVWILAIAVFPLALIVFWRYDVTAEGIQRTPSADADTNFDLTLRRSDYAILAGVGVVAVAVLWSALASINEEVIADSGPWYDGGSNVERIVVLPLEDQSSDEGQQFLAAGLHDALISTMSRIARFRVTSRFSSLRIRDDMTLEGIREQLGVDHVLTGSVAREDDIIRVTVSLVDAASGSTLWTDSLTREMAGLLDLQKEIASSVAREVNLVLTPEEERKLRPGDTPDAATYEAYLKGMVQLRRGSPRAYRRAIDILTEAVESAPTSALAYAGLAIAYAQLGHSPFPVDGAYPRAREAAARAIEFDPELPEAWLAIAMYKMYYEWDFPGAEEAFQQAFDLNPSLVDAHYHYAWLLELWKRDEEAIRHGEYTVELNPLSPFYSAWLADQYRDARRYDEALATAEMTAGLNPDYPVTLLVLGQIYLDMGRTTEAIETHAKLRDNGFWGYAYAATLATAGRVEDALAARESFESKRRNAFTDTLLNGGLGDTEATLASLVEAREEKIPWYPWLLNYFPQTAHLHEHPMVEQFASEIDIPLMPTEALATQ